eukprot:gene5700-biopygen13298
MKTLWSLAGLGIELWYRSTACTLNPYCGTSSRMWSVVSHFSGWFGYRGTVASHKPLGDEPRAGMTSVPSQCWIISSAVSNDCCSCLLGASL